MGGKRKADHSKRQGRKRKETSTTDNVQPTRETQQKKPKTDDKTLVVGEENSQQSLIEDSMEQIDTEHHPQTEENFKDETLKQKLPGDSSQQEDAKPPFTPASESISGNMPSSQMKKYVPTFKKKKLSISKCVVQLSDTTPVDEESSSNNQHVTSKGSTSSEETVSCDQQNQNQISFSDANKESHKSQTSDSTDGTEPPHEDGHTETKNDLNKEVFNNTKDGESLHSPKDDSKDNPVDNIPENTSADSAKFGENVNNDQGHGKRENSELNDTVNVQACEITEKSTMPLENADVTLLPDTIHRGDELAQKADNTHESEKLVQKKCRSNTSTGNSSQSNPETSAVGSTGTCQKPTQNDQSCRVDDADLQANMSGVGEETGAVVDSSDTSTQSKVSLTPQSIVIDDKDELQSTLPFVPGKLILPEVAPLCQDPKPVLEARLVLKDKCRCGSPPILPEVPKEELKKETNSDLLKDCMVKLEEFTQELTDSQLCQVDENVIECPGISANFTDCSSGIRNLSTQNQKPDQDIPSQKPPQRTEGDRIVRGLIAELTLFNKILMKTKREMEAVRRQYNQNPRAPAKPGSYR